MVAEVTAYSEVREIKVYRIQAKTKADAEEILKRAITSQDKVTKMTGMRWGYEAEVSHLVARDWPILIQTPD